LIIVRARLGAPRGEPGAPHDTCEFRFHARRAVAPSTSPTCALGVVAGGWATRGSLAVWTRCDRLRLPRTACALLYRKRELGGGFLYRGIFVPGAQRDEGRRDALADQESAVAFGFGGVRGRWRRVGIG